MVIDGPAVTYVAIVTDVSVVTGGAVVIDIPVVTDVPGLTDIPVHGVTDVAMLSVPSCLPEFFHFSAVITSILDIVLVVHILALAIGLVGKYNYFPLSVPDTLANIIMHQHVSRPAM